MAILVISYNSNLVQVRPPSKSSSCVIFFKHRLAVCKGIPCGGELFLGQING